MAVEQVGKGATSIEERLKDVLKHLESESEILLVFIITVQYLIRNLSAFLVAQIKSLSLPPSLPLSSL